MKDLTDQGKSVDEDEPLKLRADYWSKRLDHTLTHTQTSSQLIYLIDGAVLALVYFVIQAFGGTRTVVGCASVAMLVLAGLNVMHALFIKSQHSWYVGIDAKLLELLAVKPVPLSGGKRAWWHGTHGIYQAMHWWIAAFLVLAASAMIAYGFGHFPDLVPKSAPSLALQSQCSARADAGGLWSGSVYSSHYNAQLNRCTVSSRQASATNDPGGQHQPAAATFETRELFDAFEGRSLGIFRAYSDRPSAPVACFVELPSGQTNSCLTEVEWESLIRVYLER